MAGNGRRCRSRWDNAADVAQTVRAGALSPQDLMSRHADGRLTAFLKLDVEQLKEECGSGRRWAHTEPWSPNAPQTISESRWRVSARIDPLPASRLSGES
jgi:hypothetical protein